MKTVLVCAVQAPFVTGGAEILVSELRDNLARRGFRVDVVSVPFHGHPPSELVRQRPDIRAAEALLHAASAAIGVATAQLFPSITLSGSIGSQALTTGALFTGPGAATMADVWRGRIESVTQLGDDLKVVLCSQG